MKTDIKQMLRENLSKTTKNNLTAIEIISKYDSLKKALSFIIKNNKSRLTINNICATLNTAQKSRPF